MNALLNFKNKRFESKFFPSLDSYTWNILCAHSILAIVGITITPIKEYYFSRQTPDHSKKADERFLRSIGFAVLFFIAVIVRLTRRRLERFKDAVRWILDIFYTATSVYIIFVFSRSRHLENPTTFLYPEGWWHFFVCCLVFGPISRWYLQMIAFLAMLIQLAFFRLSGSYAHEDLYIVVLSTVQIAVGLFLTIYWLDYSKKRDFITKIRFQEENESLKQLLDQGSDEVVICDLHSNIQYQSKIFLSYPWWDARQPLLVNLDKIHVKAPPQAVTADTVIDVNKTELEESHTLAPMITGLMKNAEKLKNPIYLSVEGKIPPMQGYEQELYLQIKILSTIYNGNPGLALVLKNTTLEKLAAKFEEREEYKDRLLASVSHELRTSLNATLHFIQEAIDDPETSKPITENYLIHCQNTGKFLLNLINDILDASQISKNKLRLVYENCDVQKTLNECCDLLNLQAQKKGIKLTNTFSMQTPRPDFCTDHNRLKQILLNLLSNSLKFTLEGKISITATLSPSLEYGKVLHIEVSDTGIGISDEGLKQMFKPFEKIDLGDKISLNSMGAGLGLSISNSLAKLLGPADNPQGLKVESQLQQGTKFSFLLVDKEFPKAMEYQSDHSENYNYVMNEGWDITTNLDTLSGFLSKREFRGGIRTPMTSYRRSCVCPQVLFVDDDVFNTSTFENFMQKLGYSCEIAFNGSQGITKFLDRQKGKCQYSCKMYQIIFTDLNMPLMDGFEMAKEIKRVIRENKLDEIPIIGCSAVIQDNERNLGKQVGIDAFCEKPLDRDKILNLVHKFMK